MTTSSRVTFPLLVALCFGATVVAAPACGDDSSTGTGGSGSSTGTGGQADDSDAVVYEGGATDEALEELLAAAAPTTNAAETASFSAPLPDTVLPAAAPATFSWALPAPAGSTLEPRLFGPHRFEPGGDPIPRRVGPGAFERAATTVLGALLAGVPEAHAHGDPVNGRAFLVVFASATDPELLRVFTTETTYVPDDAAWTKLKGAGEPITASITSAVFEANRVAQGGGPFTGGSVTFTITE